MGELIIWKKDDGDFWKKSHLGVTVSKNEFQLTRPNLKPQLQSGSNWGMCS